MKEMEWFIKASKPFRGMEINVVSETIPTHEYESKVLTKAFFEITGIKVTHDLIQEGDVIEKLQTQMQSGKNVFDAYVNDSDLIGTHSRYGHVVPLDRLHGGRRQGRDPSHPGRRRLHGQIVHHRSRTASSISCPTSSSPTSTGSAMTGSSGRTCKAQFKEKYGYELGVPVNWSAYEDIAEFFTEQVKEIDGKAGLRPHGLRQESARPGLALHRRLAFHGRRRRQGPAQRQAGRRMGHPGGRGTAVRWAPAWRAAARPTARPPSTPCANTWSGCASMLRPARWAWTSTSPAGAGQGQRGPADLLVHRLHRRHGGEAWPHGQRRRHAPKWRMAPRPTAPTGKKA
jgi:hypothetical protein